MQISVLLESFIKDDLPSHPSAVVIIFQSTGLIVKESFLLHLTRRGENVKMAMNSLVKLMVMVLNIQKKGEG